MEPQPPSNSNPSNPSRLQVKIGRQPVVPDKILYQDQHYTQQVVLILLAINNYTREAGLPWGYFMEHMLQYVDRVDQEVFFQEEIRERDREWLANMIVRMRYAMARQPADEFERVIKEVYATLLLKINVSVEALTRQILNIIHQTEQDYCFMLLNHKDLRKIVRGGITFNNENLRMLIREIILSVRQSLIEKGKMEYPIRQ